MTCNDSFDLFYGLYKFNEHRCEMVVIHEWRNDNTYLLPFGYDNIIGFCLNVSDYNSHLCSPEILERLKSAMSEVEKNLAMKVVSSYLTAYFCSFSDSK